MSHSDRLYLRCSFCGCIVLLARTNANTRQFCDFVKLEGFIKQHLKCNPHYQGENLLGIAGFDVTAWSDMIYNPVRSREYTIDLSRFDVEEREDD